MNRFIWYAIRIDVVVAAAAAAVVVVVMDSVG